MRSSKTECSTCAESMTKSKTNLQPESPQPSELVVAPVSATHKDSMFSTLSTEDKLLYVMAMLEAVSANVWNGDLLYLSARRALDTLNNVGLEGSDVTNIVNELLVSCYERGNTNPFTRMWR